jgi:hypothetical protein
VWQGQGYAKTSHAKQCCNTALPSHVKLEHIVHLASHDCAAAFQKLAAWHSHHVRSVPTVSPLLVHEGQMPILHAYRVATARIFTVPCSPGPDMKATTIDSASPTAFFQSSTNEVDASIPAPADQFIYVSESTANGKSCSFSPALPVSVASEHSYKGSLARLTHRELPQGTRRSADSE